jgi:ribonuclease P protein component
MKIFSFPRPARIVYGRDFRRIYRNGRRFIVFPLRFCVLPRQEEGSRLGLAVSRKVGGAVVRNRWKRAIRETFRLERARISVPHDIVVSVSWEAETWQVACVAEAFEALIARLNATGAAAEE